MGEVPPISTGGYEHATLNLLEVYWLRARRVVVRPMIDPRAHGQPSEANRSGPSLLKWGGGPQNGTVQECSLRCLLSVANPCDDFSLAKFGQQFGPTSLHVLANFLKRITRNISMMLRGPNAVYLCSLFTFSAPAAATLSQSIRPFKYYARTDNSRYFLIAACRPYHLYFFFDMHVKINLVHQFTFPSGVVCFFTRGPIRSCASSSFPPSSPASMLSLCLDTSESPSSDVNM